MPIETATGASQTLGLIRVLAERSRPVGDASPWVYYNRGRRYLIEFDLTDDAAGVYGEIYRDNRHSGQYPLWVFISSLLIAQDGSILEGTGWIKRSVKHAVRDGLAGRFPHVG